jgi:hypothetical protein
VVTHYDEGFTNFRVYPLSEYSSDLAKRHRSGNEISISYFTGLAKKIFPSEILTENPFAKNNMEDTD